VLMDEYMRMVAKEKAREIYMKRFTHKFNSVQEQYLGDFLDPKAKSPDPFTGRSTPSVYCIGRMLMDGHDLKDIMDPRALKDKKKTIGQEYKNLYNRHDAQQYSENMYQCALAIKAAVLNYIKEHKDEIKTPQDLAMHAEPLARLSMYCCDLTQELNKCVKHVKNVKAEDLLHLGNELERFMTIAGTGETGIIYYDNLEVLSPIILGKEITRQLSIKAFLEELQKDEPDIANLPSYDDNGSLAAQIATLSELNEWYYNSNVGINDPADFNKEKIRVIGSMMSQDYLNKNNIRYDRPRVPASVKVRNEKTMSYPLEVGEGLSVVVSRGGEQLIETNVPARMDQYIRSLEKEDLRGKESGNSDQFNTMMRSFDESMGKLGDLKVDNPECLEEMAKLKEAALAYINAKRAQKGYEPVGMVPDAFDDQMLGKKKGGPSIFTSRGKERYEFAWKTIWRATEMERAIREKMQPKVELSNDNPIQNNPIQDNPIQNNEIQNNEIKDNQVQDIQIQNNQENELPKEEPKQPTEQKKTAPVEVEKNINPKYAKIKGILESWNEHVKEQQEETGLPLTLAGTVGEFETIAPELVDVQALGEILGYPDPVDVRGFNVDVVMRALAQKLPQIDMYVDNEMQKEDVQNEEMKKEELDDDFAFS
ncbi:MAG: hypothetical protein IKU20_01755, partial [Lachnospiraceae bacterium]|nr:hypothetical protein [Lachnospiraceae bacterium]